MSLSRAQRPEIYKLLACQREGEGDAASLDRLNSILRGDQEAREYYIQQMLLSAHLCWMIARSDPTAPPAVDGDTAPEQADAPGRSLGDTARTGQGDRGPVSGNAAIHWPPPGAKSPTVLSFLGVLDNLPSWILTPKVIGLTVASLLGSYFGVLALSVILSRSHSGVAPDGGLPHEHSDSFATLSRTVDPRWQGSAPQFAGGRLPVKEYVLEAGFVELVLDGGARIAIEGPTRFQPGGANALSLHEGRLAAHVPPTAVGFKVITPTAEVVDRGTEFDVEVDPRGNTDVQVRKGNVEVKPTAKAAAAVRSGKSVAAGQAVRVAVDDLKPVSIEFSATRFAAVQSTLAEAADKSSAEQFLKGQPIWLGNLFDDPPSARLAEAMLTDTFQAVPKPHASLGVERMFHYGKPFGSDDGMEFWDGGGKLQIAPGVTLDLTNLGWKGMRSGGIANDAYVRYEDLPGIVRSTASISTRGTLPVPPDAPKIEEGIGMQADAMLTFDLNAIRAAGGLAGRKLLFYSNRAGINDGNQAPRNLASVYMGVFVVGTNEDVVAAQVNGRSVRVTKHDDVWSVATVPGKPLSGLDEPVSFVVRMPAEARYLTLITTVAGDTNGMDHAVWSGACLKVVP